MYLDIFNSRILSIDVSFFTIAKEKKRKVRRDFFF